MRGLLCICMYVLNMWAVSSFGLSCDPGCTNISCANIWILVFNSLGLETEKWSFWVTRQTYFWFVSAYHTVFH